MSRLRTVLRPRDESGFSIMEVMVAGSLLGLLTVGLSSSAAVTTDLLRIHHSRASSVIVINALRARMIADARESTEALCSGTDRLVLNVDHGMGIVFATDYSVDAGRLVRWRNPPDKEFVLMDDAVSLECADLGDEGTEVSVLFGDAVTPSHFYFLLAEKPAGGS